MLTFPEIGAAVLFPPYAVLTAALLIAPIRWWGLLIVAAAAGNFIPHNNFEQSLSFVALSEVANVTRALVAAGGIRLLCGRNIELGTLRGMAVFLAFAGLLGPLAGALIGAADVVLHNPGASVGLTFRAWLMSNVLTGITLLPLLFVAATRGIEWKGLTALRTLEAAALAAGLLWVGIRVLAQPPEDLPSLAPYEPLPLVLWAAVRFGLTGTVGALSALTIAAIHGAIHGAGPFATQSPAVNLIQLQSFLITLNIPLLLLAAVMQERAQAARALQRSQSQYRSVVEDQTELICRYLPDGTLTFVNDAYCRYFGRAPDELVGSTWWQFLPAADQEAARRLLNSIKADNPVASWEHSVLSPGGETRWQHWTDRGFFDLSGAVVEFQSVGRDVTRRKRAEEAERELAAKRQTEIILRESEERFRLLADIAPVLIWMSGLENQGIHFNRKWLAFTGRALEEELGAGWIESIHPDDRERCTMVCNAAFRLREPMIVQFRLRRNDGEYRWMLDNGIPYTDADGAFKGYIGTCVDFTEQRDAEEAMEQSARRKDEFLAMLGHELRNPLAPIGLAVDLLHKQGSDEESVAWARDVVTRQLRQLSRLVDDLLDVSRISRGTIQLNESTVDFADIVADAVETSRPLITAHNHELLLDIESCALPVRGDPARLVQVVSNLLNNAAKYTEVGGRISVRVRQCDQRVELDVIDTGVGIPAHQLDEIFEMFRQVDNGSGDSKGGLGIGLTLVKNLVEMHGGTIEARSAGPGQGSEFTVRLPCAPVEVGAQDNAEALAVSGPPAPAVRRRILIVDDNTDAAAGLDLILRYHEHEVAVVHDGPAALAAAERFDPEIVLLDIGLPGMSGLEVARRLKARSGGDGPLLVATTGYGQAEDRHRAAEAGFDYHLTKPIDLEFLVSLITQGPPVRDAPSRR